MKKRALSALALLLSLVFLLAPLTACSLFEGDGDLAALVSREAQSYFSGGTVTIPADRGTDSTTVVEKEAFVSFLALVNYDKVEVTEEVFSTYYIGEFRKVEDCVIEIFDYIIANYYFDRAEDTEVATAIFINSYLGVLGDRYAYYYDPSAYGEYTEDISGEYSGIGVSVTLNEDGYADILTVFADSPAEEAGLLPGDLIVAVEGVDFAEIGYQEAINRVRGEVGTAVTLTIERDGARADYTVTRRRVTEITVEAKLLDGDVGYIRITSFDDRTYEQFVEAYTWLLEDGATSLVFDVRNNPGGTLTSVVAILEYILPDGDIVHMNYKNPKDDYTIDSIFDISSRYMDGIDRVYYAGHEITLPLAVLANGNTASAGELFTSSLKDYGVAVVVGEKTYGKGVGQSSFYVDKDGSAVTVTLFSYDPPTSKNYDGVGITPDSIVALSEEASKKNIYKLTYDEDTQLQAAIALLASPSVP